HVPIQQIVGLLGKARPNRNHHLIGELAKLRWVRVVGTTNFDELVELAFMDQGLELGRDFQVLAREEQFDILAAGVSEKSPIQLIKLHGTCSDETSIRTTLRAVASRDLSDARAHPLRELFSTGRHDTVLVLGYSCSDHFDIN